MRRFWQRLAAVIARHPVRVLVGAGVVVLALGVGVTRLEFTTGQDTLVDPDSTVFKENARYQDEFGGEPMLVLLTGDIREMATGETLEEIRALEEDLRATGQFDAVVGPATALDFAMGQLTVAPQMFAAADEREVEAAAREAREDAEAEGLPPEEVEAVAASAAEAKRAEREALFAAEMERLSAAGEPSLDNPAFVDFLLFDGEGEIRPGLRDNFLDEEHGMILVRLPGNASIEEQSRGADAVDEVIERHPISGVEILASGPPVLLAEINDYLQGGMATLGAIAVGVMVVVLLLVFRTRWPLLPLVVVVIGSLGAFGAVGAAGIPLSLVTISGLPILIGLGVDFAIQMHNRFEEERDRGHMPESATARTYSHMGPPLVLAMLAAVAGFLALQWSQVPMIKDFGGMLSVGVVVLVLVALATTVPALVLANRRGRRRRGGRARRMELAVRRLSSLPGRTAVPLLVVGAVIVTAGFVAEGGMPIQTDPERWVDQDGEAVAELEALREGTGFSSEVSILVEADDVTDPEVAAWVQRFGSETVARHSDKLLRATSMAALATGLHGAPAGGEDVSELLSVAPEDAARSLIATDRRSASVVFPIAPISLNEREELLEDINDDLEGDLAPPEGVTATPAGLAVVGVELVNGLEAGQRTLTLLALGLVFAWLLIARRSPVRAVVVLVPVSIAVALSSLAVAGLGIELTPMTTVAGPLVIAVATEFSVLVVARYEEERERGLGPVRAVDEGVPRIGRAFVASGLTLIGGFGVLAFSPMPLLRDFGVVVALAVAFALASTLVFTPPLLVWADTRTWLHGSAPGAAEAAEPVEASRVRAAGAGRAGGTSPGAARGAAGDAQARGG